MPRPLTPDAVDGLPLDAAQRQRFDALIAMIHSPQPGRAAEAILALALDAFRMTVRRVGGAWVDVASLRLDGGRGPVVRTPAGRAESASL